MSGARRNKILPKTAGHDADTAPVSSRRSLCLGPSSPTFEFLVHKDKFHALYGARDCSPLRLLIGIADCTSYYLYPLHSRGTNIVVIVYVCERHAMQLQLVSAGWLYRSRVCSTCSKLGGQTARSISLKVRAQSCTISAVSLSPSVKFPEATGSVWRQPKR